MKFRKTVADVSLWTTSVIRIDTVSLSAILRIKGFKAGRRILSFVPTSMTRIGNQGWHFLSYPNAILQVWSARVRGLVYTLSRKGIPKARSFSHSFLIWSACAIPVTVRSGSAAVDTCNDEINYTQGNLRPQVISPSPLVLPQWLFLINTMGMDLASTHLFQSKVLYLSFPTLSEKNNLNENQSNC